MQLPRSHPTKSLPQIDKLLRGFISARMQERENMFGFNTKRLALLMGMVSACQLTGCYWPTGIFSTRRSLAIPETYPLGSNVRSHYHQMETNGEAEDFVIHRHEFIGASAELNSFGLDHLLEIAARMRTAPFPILIERSENNSDPELDQFRRRQVAEILTALGNPAANARTIVSQDYDPGIAGPTAASNYKRFIELDDDDGRGGGRGGGGGGGFGGGAGGFGGGGGGGGFR